MVLVSVVMPSYNHEKYIAEAISSVLNQTFKNFELIIIDDCSTDNSQKIIETYEKKDSRVKSFFHRENMGISRTYNDGIKQAKGKFLALLDSDDLWVATKLEKQLEVLKTNEDLVIWSEGEIIDQNGKSTGKTFTQFEKGMDRKKSGNIFEELLYTDNFVFDSSLILKKENLPKQGFDETLKYLGDYRFVVDLARYHEFYFQREPLAKYRIHGYNTIFSNWYDWQIDRVTLYQYFLDEYGNIIPPKLKSYLLFRKGWAYAELGEKELARQNIFSAIKVNVLGKRTIPYLIVALTGVRLMV